MKIRRVSAILMAVIMLLTCMAGCGKTGADGNTGGENGVDGALSQYGGSVPDSRLTDENIAMGRYVEEVIDVADRTDWYGCNLHRLSDGRIVLSDKYGPFLISDDNGATWKEDDREWHSELRSKGTYAFEIAVGADNTAAVIYNDGPYDTGTQEYTGNQRLLVIRPDRTENLIDIPLIGADKYPYKVGIADNGRIFVSISNGNELYEVKEDGSCEYFMTVQGDSPRLMQFQGNLMFLDVGGSEQLLIYDMEKKEYIEDEVLSDFIKENYPDGNSYNGTETYQMYFFTGEEGVIYIAGKKGLHRHVIGGSAIEQLIDGSRGMFNNPSYEIRDMLMIADNEFLALYGIDRSGSSDGFGSAGSEGRLVRYNYDSDVAAVAVDSLNIYSLKENDTIRQAIAGFLADYPDVEVVYEIGMEEGGSVTREDALKKLNTKIMSGGGPDILILDDMPIDSYIEKGVLMDLDTILGSLSGEEEIFGSIVQAMKKDGKAYTVPCEIQIPVIMGEGKYISRIKDLESTADVMEELRRENPGKDLLNICTEKGIMRYFAMSCVPAWTTESGELDREAIEQFYKQTKRIYDAQMDGLPEEIIKEYNRVNEVYLENRGEYRDDSAFLRTDDNFIHYAGGLIQLSHTALSSAGVYDTMVSVNKAEGFQTNKWTVMNGLSSNVFCAKTLIGVSAATKNDEAAERFLRMCLGREVQSNLFYGLAVNKSAFEEKFIIEDNTERFVFINSNSEGVRLEIKVYPSDSEQIADLEKCIDAAEIPYIENTVLENAVYEGGIRYIQGEWSLEEAVDEIEKKISIYLAE